MSRHASRLSPRGACTIGGVLALVNSLAGAQTIADYSHAQRLALESAMTQAAARSAGLGAPPPAAAASVAVAPASTPVRAALPLPAPAPDVQVSGVFASSGSAVAEVVVNSTPYLLEPGERVPGTSWEVRMVAVDRVVLGRRGGEAAHDTGAGLRVFALPALR